MNTWEWTFLGRVPYRRALALQYSYARRVFQGANPRVFFVEHPPTVTLGRSAISAHLKLSENEYRRRGLEVCRTQRGGGITYHGPGQLIGYPIARIDRLQCSVPRWVRGHGDAIIRFLKRRQIAAHWSDLHPGVWVGLCKIAALGFHLSRSVSTHGFALNLDTDLSKYETFVPCGLPTMRATSLAALGKPVPPLWQAAEELAWLVAESFGGTLSREIAVDQTGGEFTNGVASVAVS